MGTTLKFLSENTVRKCTFGKANTDGKFIDGADFFSETGRIDLLKRMHIKGCLYEFLARYNFAADFSRDLLNDTGALARAALEFLEKKGDL